MFAFGGASTFPTIQADMGDKSQFKWAAMLSCLALLLIYAPVMAVGYVSLGDCIQKNVIASLSAGPAKKAAEGMIMVHLISTLPIVVNAPNQYLENVLKIPHCTCFSSPHIISK
jgi:vesicular inhibitory amino acid transporter